MQTRVHESTKYKNASKYSKILFKYLIYEEQKKIINKENKEL